MQPYVHNFPVLTSSHNEYVNNLIDLTATSNPQEEPEVSQDSAFHPAYADVVSPSPSKRRRNGTSKQQDMHSNLPTSLTQPADPSISKNLDETMAKLKHLETSGNQTKDSLEMLSRRLDKQGQEISTLGQALQSTNSKVDQVCTTQVMQGNTMVQMNDSLKNILRKVEKLNSFNAQFSDMAESPQGGGVMEE